MLNLWELLTSAQTTAPRYKRQEITDMIRELSSRSSTGQELSIGTTERGWVLKIFSCYHDWEVVILIPSNIGQPIEIVADTRGNA